MLPEPALPVSGRLEHFSDDAWVEVLSAMDRTYADLVSYQEQLERQNAELQEMRTFLTAILSSVSDVLIVADRSGRVVQVSRSVGELTGGPERAVLGKPLSGLFEPAHVPLLEAVLSGLRESRKSAQLEANLATTAGSEPLDISIAPRLDERGRVDGFVLTGRPMGALRKAYAELSESHDALKTAQAQLVRNEKLASLGRLLAGVAHELNNPISFVYANAHALGRYATKFETYFARVQEGAGREELIALRAELRLDRELANLREAIRGAHDGAERVRDIVEDLRRLSSDGSGEKVMFDLAETVRIAASWVMRGMKQPVTLTMEPMQSVQVRGRQGHLQQVVMNLVQNAFDALEGRAGAEIRLSVTAEPGRAVLTVADNGPGVSEELRALIFDPFFTTKAVGRGTGLGLAISLKIAEEHGGSLVLCEAAAGACFRLVLPVGSGE
ncbi:MAG TPA: PAS domain-containing protein [Rhizobiales bacterium]|nr:PAS domain-containing protein [Hyphomicrobiales bacterium]